MKLQRIEALVRKELKQMMRDKLTLAMIIGIPAIQLLIFGFAINYNVRNIPAAYYDQAETQLSRRIVEDIKTMGILNLNLKVQSKEALMRAIRRGKVRAGILIPYDLESRMHNKMSAIQILVDGSSSIITSVVQGISAYSPSMETISYKTQLQKTITVLPLYNPEQRTAVDVIPALVGIILTMTMTLFTAITLVKERERGSLEMLITTPVSALEIIIGKLIPYIIIGIFQAVLVFSLGVLVFRIPSDFDVFSIAVATVLFIAATLSMGLLISSFVKTQFQAIQLTIFILLPSILLTGFVFPFEGIPAFFKPIAIILPATHFIELTRGIVLRGSNIIELSGPLAGLLLFTIATTTLAWFRMRKKNLD